MSNATPSGTPSSVPAAAPANAAPAVSKPADTSKQPVSPAVPAAKGAPQAEETWDVQENGRVIKKTRKEILEAYQLRQLSDRKRSEAEKVLGEYKKLQELGAKDPIKLMQAMGLNFDNLATQYLAKKAEDSMKDPKVLEMEKKDQELAQYKKWVEEQKASQAQKEKQAQIDSARQRIHSEIIEAVKDASATMGLPIDEDLIIAVAQNMMVQDKAKKPLNAKEALPATYAKTQKWLQGMASKMEGEAIVKWLGEDVAKKIRKYDLTQLKAKRGTVQQNGSSHVKPKTDSNQPKAKPYKTWSEFKAEKLDKIQ
jgi:predicted DNA binding CopG/RHH family protein